MVIKEKSGYLRIEVLTKNFLIEKKKFYRILKSKDFIMFLSMIESKTSLKELWREDITRTDMENWLLAEKQIKYEDFMKARKNRQEEEMIDRCIRKIYNRY